MSFSDSAGVTTLTGVGPKRAAAYAQLGIYTLRDLVMHYPRSYENRGDIKPLCEADTRGKSAHLLTVASEPRVVRLRSRKSYLKFNAVDDSGKCEIIFFNQDYLKQTFETGKEFRFYGKVEPVGKSAGNFRMSSPAFEDASAPILVPVYPLTAGISQKQIKKDIDAALSLLAGKGGEDILPEEIRVANKLCTAGFAVRNIHRPDSFTALAAAKKRLIFEELFIYSLGLAAAAKKTKTSYAFPCTDNDTSKLFALLPYELTSAQKRVISEIAEDMSKDVPMSRIVIGDVGCGKTVCAAAAMYIAAKNGRQAALMVPTEILARQHYCDLEPLFARLGIKTALLVGAMTAKEKGKVKRGLAERDKSERIDIVVGTHALLSDGVYFAAPGLIVTDEQHRFGVNQRALLSEKNSNYHMLVMSATPIPRSFALALYGDLDISVIDEMPKGRQRVDTFAVNESYRGRLNAFIRTRVESGGQVYIVCPSVEEKDPEDGDLFLSEVDGQGQIRKKPRLRGAVDFAGQIGKIFPDIPSAFLHGKMKSAEKDRLMRDFAAGKIKILVSTTVIEVGVNVPAATLMVVENAERFGLAQLHQLRGRVGRGSEKSYCVLVSDCDPKSTAGERLAAMKELYDGFAIAEKDLEIRGPGDFIASGDTGIRQSGGIRFRLADMLEDTGIFIAARDAARALIAEDPGLENHPRLKKLISDMFTLPQAVLN